MHSDKGHLCRVPIPSKMGQFRFEQDNQENGTGAGKCNKSFTGMMDLSSYENVVLKRGMTVSESNDALRNNPDGLIDETVIKFDLKPSEDTKGVSIKKYTLFYLINER